MSKQQQTSRSVRGTEQRTAGLPVRGAEQRTAGRPAPSAEQAPAGRLAPGTERRSRYIPALDGIRTLAVIAVVLYHLNLTWAQGGFLGVTIFFVLSGYLITRLLLAEFEQTDRIDLKRFWVRRVRRLVPATITLVIVVAVLCTIFNHVMLTKMRPDILPSLFFFNNWWQIAQNVSYFDALGDPSPLTHFWSLAIEEQFYVVWPVLLLIMLKLRVKRPWMRRIVVALAAVSAVAMAVLYDPAADPSRVYYGTDTRAFSMLLGAWLAFIPEGSMSPAKLLQTVGLGKLLPQRPASKTQGQGAEDSASGADGIASGAGRSGNEKAGIPAGSTGKQIGGHERLASNQADVPAHHAVRAIDAIGILALGGLVIMTVACNGYTPFMYRGGTVLCSILGLAVIAASVQPSGILARALSAGPLVWLGKRSYSIYLWHYPLLALMNPVSNIAAVPWWMHLVQLAIVLLAAELSYRFIETPFRHGVLGSTVRKIRDGKATIPAIVKRHLVPTATAGVIVLVAVGGIAFVPNTSALSKEGAELIQQTGEDGTEEGAAQQDAGSDAQQAGDATDADEDGFPDNAYDILMIGDSVSLRTVDTFNNTFTHGHIDAAKNRQFAAGKGIFSDYAQQNLAGRIVVFALGTNGPVTDDAIDSLMEVVGPDRICVFITTRSPRQWVQSTNDALKRAAERYENVRVIDWYAYSEGRNDLFDGDGTHLSSTGAQEYIALVNNEVKNDLPFHFEGATRDTTVQAVIAQAQKTCEQAGAAVFGSHSDAS